MVSFDYILFSLLLLLVNIGFVMQNWKNIIKPTTKNASQQYVQIGKLLHRLNQELQRKTSWGLSVLLL